MDPYSSHSFPVNHLKVRLRVLREGPGPGSVRVRRSHPKTPNLSVVRVRVVC